MIAKAKSISHGIRATLYVSGESRNKKHPEKITRICDNFMPQGMGASLSLIHISEPTRP